MLGFMQFRDAAITIAGIELMHRIRKGQFGLRRLGIQAELHPKSCMHDRVASARSADADALVP
jgi:hypothetical protein